MKHLEHRCQWARTRPL